MDETDQALTNRSGDTKTTDRIPLGKGAWLEVREPTLDDVEGLHDLYDGLSLEDVHSRFFSVFRPDDSQLAAWVARPPSEGRRLIACRETGAVVADGGYVRHDDGDAELDLVVARGARGWLGGYLLERLVELARQDGVPNLRADVLVQNTAMVALLHHRSYANLAQDDHTVVHLVIAVEAETPVWPRDHDRPRVLVEGGALGWTPAGLSRTLGIEVRQCPGPHPGAPCPALEGRPCPLVTGADAVVCTLGPDRDRDELLTAHRREHPDLRLFTTTPTHAGHAAPLHDRQPALVTVARALGIPTDELPRRHRAEDDERAIASSRLSPSHPR